MPERATSIISRAVETRRRRPPLKRRGRVFTAVRVLILFVILVGVSVTFYLHYVGFPQFVQNWVKNEFAKKNIEAHWSALRFDLLDGLVARDAAFYELSQPHRVLAQAQEVVVHVRVLRLTRGARAVTAISVANATLNMPAFEGFSAKEASARIYLPEPGVIEVRELRGVYWGLRLNLSGTVRLPRKTEDRPSLPTTAPEEKKDTMVRKIASELQSLRLDPAQSPEVTVRFQMDLDRLLEMQLDVQVRAQNVGYTAPDGRTLHIDDLDTQFAVTGQALEVSRFRCRLYGGELAATGPVRYDLGNARVFASVRSTTDLQKLAPFLPPSARRGLAELEFSANPEVSAEFEFSEKTGTHPVVRRGHARAVNFTYRTVPITSFRCDWEFADGIFTVKNAELAKPEGRTVGSYRVNVETTEFQAQLAGTVIPSTLYPLLTDAQMRFLSQFDFDDPVRFSNARIQGNWHFPMENEVSGQLALGRCRWRGLNFRSLVADVQWQRETVQFSNTTVRRADGQVSGGFTFNGRNGAFECAVSGSIFPQDILLAAWPEARRLLEPYRLETPPRFELRASGNANRPESVELQGQAAFGRGTAHGVPLKRGAARFRYGDRLVRVDSFDVEREEGEASGALVWDLRRSELYGELVSTVAIHETLPIFGPQAVKALAPYRFQSPPVMWATGTVAFADPARTNVRARIEGNDFVLTVPRNPQDGAGQDAAAPVQPPDAAAAANVPPPIRLEATAIGADIEYQNNLLRLKNLDATIYGGSLKGWGEFQFAKDKVTYRSEFSADKCSLADVIKAFTAKEGKVSGLLSGTARLDEGDFSSLNTLKGNARAEIVDGHLIDVPIFGLASFVLNMLPGKLGNAKAKSASATFSLADGKIRTDDMIVEAPTTKTTLKGWVGWDGSVDCEIRTRGQGITVIFDVLRWLTDVRVTGKLDKPDTHPLRLP